MVEWIANYRPYFHPFAILRRELIDASDCLATLPALIKQTESELLDNGLQSEALTQHSISSAESNECNPGFDNLTCDINAKLFPIFERTSFFNNIPEGSSTSGNQKDFYRASLALISKVGSARCCTIISQLGLLVS